MNINFEKTKKEKGGGAGHWTIYSDLFTVLTLVFLLLYVVTSFHARSYSVQNNKTEEVNQELAEKLEEREKRLEEREKQIEQQIKKLKTIEAQLVTFHQIEDSNIKNQVTEEERKVYKKLEDKLDMLAEESKKKTKDLKRKAQEIQDNIEITKKRQEDLNEYQKIVKTLIASNWRLKSKLEDKEHNLKITKFLKTEAKKKIEKVEKDLARSQNTIKKRQEELSTLKLEKENLITKYDSDIKSLKNSTAEVREDLQKKFKKERKELNQKISKLDSTLKSETSKSSQLNRKLASLNQQVTKKNQEIDNLKDNVTSLNQKYKSDIEKIKTESSQKLKNAINSANQERNQLMSQISSLESNLKGQLNKEQQLNASLSSLNSEISKKNQSLGQMKENLKNLNEKYKGEMGKVKSESEAKIGELLRKAGEERSNYLGQIKELQKEIGAEKGKGDDLSKKLASLNSDLSHKNGQIENLKGKMKGLNKKYEGQIAGLKEAANAKLGELEGKASAERGKLLGDIGKLQGELENERGRGKGLANKLAGLQNDLISKQGTINNLTDKMKGLEDKYIKAISDMSTKTAERTNIAKALNNSFKGNGLGVKVNRVSGDLVLDFGVEFFDTDKHDLKPGMEAKLRKIIPLYSKTLFDNTKNLESIEIIGFASPTFMGKAVRPDSLKPQDQLAIRYNLDLSYRRARSIFRFIFDSKQMVFDYQKQMLPLVKVTGRSYFTEKYQVGRLPASEWKLTTKEFCPRYNCIKSQKVIIKFHLKE